MCAICTKSTLELLLRATCSTPNKSWHRRVDNIPMVKHPALLWPFVASDQHLFQGFMGVMSSYTLQLGPRSGAALFRTWQGDPCHHVIHGADQLQLLFCGSEPPEQGHPNLSTDLSKRPANTWGAVVWFEAAEASLVTSPSIGRKRPPTLRFSHASVVSPCRSLSSCALVQHLPGPGGLVPL